MKFGDNFLFYTLIPLIILFVGASYVRFMVNYDYLVAYEGMCDPTVNSCFVGCDDEECTSEYYYSNIQKYAANLHAQCGDDITDCDFSNLCLPNETTTCSISYCDPEVESNTCESITNSDDSLFSDKIPNEIPEENLNFYATTTLQI